MTIPAQGWAELSQAEKRDRTLEAADRLFAREGLDAPMPALAEALGIGVGSIYRQVGNKEDLIGALVIERSKALSRRFDEATARPDAWQALKGAVHETVDDCLRDALTQSAWDQAAIVSDEVRTARQQATDSLTAMFDRARESGQIADEASPEDLRLLFFALREFSSVGSDQAHRFADLVLRGIRS
ncbi:MAG: TetR/AcrR family transcriptional regulator [Solirubrobacterales bacterium]|nr:TetR/AcrR family transcriptional regulator [Solirubrobacterales bacterium]OJU94531.1 MAG: TetR family transcriptional regulator [Solirubrobacterales bacterium 67-14]